MVDLLGLELVQLVLHAVPSSSSRDPGEPVRLSEAVVDLTADNRRYVRERLVKDLARDAREVIEDPGVESAVPPAVREFLAGARDSQQLVAMSQILALHLREVQTGVNSPGMVLVADCLLDGSPAVLIAKVELERGIQTRPVTVNGHLTYDMTLLDDLVFGQTSRIYKVGLFLGLAQDATRLIGIAIDRQAGGPDLAGFFLSAYLGCEYTQRPEVLTRAFVQSTEQWLNANISDPEVRTRYEVALLAELGSQTPEISPSEFADRVIDLEHRDRFKREVANQQAVARFPKDTQLVSFRRVRIETAEGVTLLAEPSVADDLIEVDDASITIRDRIAKVSGDGRVRRRLLGDVS